MSADDWWDEAARRPPAELAAQLARARVWGTELRFVQTDTRVDEAAPLLGLDERFAHAFVLVLNQLPEASRVPFAERFYRGRRVGDGARRDPLAVAAAVVLSVLELTGNAALQTPRIVDLVQGTAQGDDPALTSEPALAEIRKAVARVRLDLELEEQSEPRAAAAIAAAEVLDPSSGVVPLQEILVRAAWAAVRSWETDRVLEFLIDVDELMDTVSGS